jgi:large subunit ribosomal protein L23
MRPAHLIIQDVCLTEKATRLSEGNNQYTLRVRPDATKQEIRFAVEQLFKKKAVRVNTSQVEGKKKRMRTGRPGHRPHWKKAIVTLKAGDKLELV